MNYRELLFPEYLIAFIGLIGFSAWYIFYEVKKRAFKLHIPFIILLSALFIISSVVIITFPSEFKVDVPVFNEIEYTLENVSTYVTYTKHAFIYVTLEQRILYILSSFALLYLVYIFIWVLPRKLRYVKELDFAMYFAIFFGLVAIIYSLFADGPKYIQFFNALTQDVLFPYGINSFLGNRNSFGTAMTIACFACLYLHHTNKKWWLIPLAIFFTLWTVLISSKTNVLVCALVLFIYIVAIFILQFKKRLRFSLIVVAIVGFLLVVFAGLSIIHAINNSFMETGFGYIEKLYDFFILNAFQNANSFTGRNKQYSKVLLLLNNGYWVTGLGYGLFGYVFQGLENIANIPNLYVYDQTTINTYLSDKTVLTDTPHSAYFQVLGTGGIITLVIYILIILYLIYAMVRMFKKHKLTVITCAAFLVAVLLHGFTESPSLFFMGPAYIDSIVFTSFAALPILSLYYHEKHPSENKVFLEYYEVKDTKIANYKEPNLVTKSIYFFLTIAVVMFCGVWFNYVNPTFETNAAYLIIMLVVLGLYLVCPIVIHLIMNGKDKFVDFLLDVTLPYFVTALVYIGFSFITRLVNGSYTFTYAVLLTCFFVLYYFGLFSVSEYLRKKAGIVTYVLDLLSNATYKHQVKYIQLSDEKDSYTLEEKFFRLLTPKRFRKDEARDN